MKEKEALLLLLSLLAIGILAWITFALKPLPEPEGPRWLTLMY
jgi:hypothetical protein